MNNDKEPTPPECWAMMLRFISREMAEDESDARGWWAGEREQLLTLADEIEKR